MSDLQYVLLVVYVFGVIAVFGLGIIIRNETSWDGTRDPESIKLGSRIALSSPVWPLVTIALLCVLLWQVPRFFISLAKDAFPND